MTTIAYRNGIIAADTGLTAAGLRDSHITKIVKNTAGEIAGGAGDAWWLVAFLDWFKNGCSGELPAITGTDYNTAVSICRRRKVTCYESGEGKNRIFQVRAPFHALGSGRRIAMGAMFVGAHPVDAVKAAIALDDGTHGRVESLKLGW